MTKMRTSFSKAGIRVVKTEAAATLVLRAKLSLKIVGDTLDCKIDLGILTGGAAPKPFNFVGGTLQSASVTLPPNTADAHEQALACFRGAVPTDGSWVKTAAAAE